jgi:hypothetical protein
MSNFKGYYMRIGNCTFNNPAPLRETWKFAPALVQVGDSGVVASGKLKIKVLPHARSKIWCEFPVMTPEQFRIYWKALHSDAGGHGMYLTIEVYDDSTDSYVTDTYYHNDLMYTPVYYGGRQMIKIDAFELIGH